MTKVQKNNVQNTYSQPKRQKSVITYLQNKTDENLSAVFQLYKDVADNCARKYFNKYPIDKQDIIQEAYISLIEALQTYQEEKALFSTYAENCIKYRLLDYVSTYKSLYYSLHFRRLLTALRKEKNKLKLREDENIPIEQLSIIAKNLNTSMTNIIQANNALNIRFVHQTEEGENIIELCPDKRPNAERQYIAQEMKSHWKNLLHLLTEREKTVIIKHYFQGLTLEKIGQELHLTKERARQINKSALEKIQKDYKIKFNL